jgi:hypothetical protein
MTWSSFTIPVANADEARERMEILTTLAEDARWGTREGALDTVGMLEDPARFDALFPVGSRSRDMLSRWLTQCEGNSFGDWAVQTEDGKPVLFLYHDETIDMERAVELAQLMLEVDGNDSGFVAEWANVCDKPRPGEFGGGAVAFTRWHSAWKPTSQAGHELKAAVEVRDEN